MIASSDWPEPVYVAVVPGRPVLFTDDGYEAICWVRAHGGMALRVADGQVIHDGPTKPTPRAAVPAACPSDEEAGSKRVPWSVRALAIAREKGVVTAHDMIALGCKESNAYQTIANLRDRGDVVADPSVRGRYVLPTPAGDEG